MKDSRTTNYQPTEVLNTAQLAISGAKTAHNFATVVFKVAVRLPSPDPCNPQSREIGGMVHWYTSGY